MEIFLLGAVEVRVAGKTLDIGPRKQRLVLAALALEAGRHVPAERLADLVWPVNQPPTARSMLHTYISRLRGALPAEGVSLDGDAAGYVLRCAPERIDVHRFRHLLTRARGHGDDQRMIEDLMAALALWRGPALAGTASGDIRSRLCSRLEEERLTALEDVFQARLRLGHQQAVADEIVEIATEHPFRPRLTGALMRALHRTGRTAEALTTYENLRRRLSEENGLDPPAELRDLHQAILQDDLDAEPYNPVGADSTPIGGTTPRQLPRDLKSFTGRSGELKALLTAGQTVSGEGPGTVVITAIDGMAGIGKTALAIHAAHGMADLYPDGQLFIDLRGFTQGMEPLEPSEALDHLLRALGVPGEEIPPDLEARAAMYRTRLAGSRTLVMLDNAAGEPQVRPLLPATPGCTTLVTSRRRLLLDDSEILSLDILPHADAVSLFNAAAGAPRVAAAPPELISEVVELCGRIPLAIRIAAAQLTSHPGWTVATVAERLRDHQSRLSELGGDERSVVTGIEVSYQMLGPPARRMYRLLGLYPGSEMDDYAAAALAGTDLHAARGMLDELVVAHLLEEFTPGRYGFHDLIRDHAAETATRQETPDERWTALDRLFAYFAHTASLAADTVFPGDRHRPKIPDLATPVPAFDGEDGGHAWLDAELPNLLAAARAALDEHPAYTTHLSRVLWFTLDTRARYDDAYALHNDALAASRRTGDVLAEAFANGYLGTIFYRWGRSETSNEHLKQALTCFRIAGDRSGEAYELGNLGINYTRMALYEESMDYLEQCLAIMREQGNRAGEAYTLENISTVHGRLGRYDLMYACQRQAEALFRDAKNPLGEVRVLIGLGFSLSRRNRHQEAIDCERRAIEAFREMGNRIDEAIALHGLGVVYLRQGNGEEAVYYHQRSIDLFLDSGDAGGRGMALNDLGLALRATHRPVDAVQAFEQALDLAAEISDRHELIRAYDGLARAHLDLGKHDRVRRHWTSVLDTLTELGLPRSGDVIATDIRRRLSALP